MKEETGGDCGLLWIHSGDFGCEADMRYSFTVGQAGGRERIEGGYKIKKKYFEYEATIVYPNSLHYTKM